MEDTAISGSLPTEWGSLSALTDLILKNCLLTGILPTQWSHLSHLEHL